MRDNDLTLIVARCLQNFLEVERHDPNTRYVPPSLEVMDERVRQSYLNDALFHRKVDTIVYAVREHNTALREKCEELQREKDGAYLERNKVVAALARLFPSGIARTNIEGWSDDWHGCVYIDLPTGQVSWHYHDSHAHLFDGLPAYQGAWDGHTTEEKYSRLSALRERSNIPALLAAAKQEERKRCALVCHEEFMRLKHGTQIDDPYEEMLNMEQYLIAEKLRDAIRALKD